MDFGKLNKRIVIQQLGTTQAETGEVVEAWTDFATVWADVRDVSGKEFLAAAATQNATTTKITIRHLDGVLPSMRVVHGANLYNVEAILGQDNRSLMLMCSRLV